MPHGLTTRGGRRAHTSTYTHTHNGRSILTFVTDGAALFLPRATPRTRSDPKPPAPAAIWRTAFVTADGHVAVTSCRADAHSPDESTREGRRSPDTASATLSSVQAGGAAPRDPSKESTRSCDIASVQRHFGHFALKCVSTAAPIAPVSCKGARAGGRTDVIVWSMEVEATFPPRAALVRTAARRRCAKTPARVLGGASAPRLTAPWPTEETLGVRRTALVPTAAAMWTCRQHVQQ